MLRVVEWIVAGLGNPGREYSGTRHDLGFMLVGRLAEEARVQFRREGDCEVAGPIAFPGSARALLVKPQLYMNRSGPPVRRCLERHGVPLERLLVACDDVNIPLGRLRLRPDGSAGGHNGLRSLIDCLGQGFPRLRLGVGQGPDGTDRADWVLSRFEKSERGLVDDMLERASWVVRAVLETDAVQAGPKVAAWLAPGTPGR